MDDSENIAIPGIKETTMDFRRAIMEEDLNNPVTLVERVYQIWRRWADLEIHIVSPVIQTITPPVIVYPEVIAGTSETEFVYPIHDHGNKLAASKASEMFSAGMSMCKMFYTIEKMISIIIERLKSSGISTEEEVQVAFNGHEIALRKAFESVINLSYNVVVTNFDPGVWGEEYLRTVKRIADKGYGYPTEAPRDIYKQPRSTASAGIRR